MGVCCMSDKNQTQESTSVETRTKNELNMHDILRSALDWKQWLADDLRLLIQAKKDDLADDSIIRDFVIQHLSTYDLLNRMFNMIMGDLNGDVFSMPEISELQQVVPDLTDAVESEQNHDVEPMLELQLDKLGQDLSDTLNQGVAESDSAAISDDQPELPAEDEPENHQNELVVGDAEITPLTSVSDGEQEQEQEQQEQEQEQEQSIDEHDEQPSDPIRDDAPSVSNDVTDYEKESESVSTEALVSRIWDKSFEDDFFNSKGVSGKHEHIDDNGGTDGDETVGEPNEPEQEQ